MPGRVLRLFVAELMKLQGQRFLLVALVFLVIALGLAIRRAESDIGAKSDGESSVEIDSDAEPAKPASHGFAVLAASWKWGCRAVALIVLVAGSMMISSEFAQGTLKLVFSRPVRRVELFLAKCLVLMVFSVLLIAFTMGGTWLYVGMTSGYGDVVDQKWSGHVHFSAAVMHSAVWHGAVLSLLPVLALACMGLLISTLAPGSGTSVAVAILVHLVMEAVGEYLSSEEAAWLFTSFARMPTDVLLEMSQGIAGNKAFLLETAVWSKPVLVPVVSLLVMAALAVFAFSRRDIPA
ncbi:MAG: ABC transporter permease [Planctomycetota bacterium]|nr:ABC transporter permease [Planctomycetota bacterium]